MREIKFRAWDKTEKKMIRSPYDYEAVNYFLCPFTGKTEIFRRPEKIDNSGHTGVISEVDWFYPGPFELDLVWQQYTGLKDKNGKEIYEGDICEMVPQLSGSEEDCWQTDRVQVTIKWFPDECRLRPSYKEDEDKKFSDCQASWVWKYNNFYIIGNIYENPELEK